MNLGQASPDSPSRILVVGPAWVGDMVMAQSLFAGLKSRQPQSTIDVLAPRWTLPLLRFMPEVRRAIEQPLGHGELGLFTRLRLGKALRGEGYDLALVLPGSPEGSADPALGRDCPAARLWRRPSPAAVERCAHQIAAASNRKLCCADRLAGPAATAPPHTPAGCRYHSTAQPRSCQTSRAYPGNCARRRIRPSQALARTAFRRGCRKAAGRWLAGLAVRLTGGPRDRRQHSLRSESGRPDDLGSVGCAAR